MSEFFDSDIVKEGLEDIHGFGTVVKTNLNRYTY